MLQRNSFVIIFLLVASLVGQDTSVAVTVNWKNPVSGSWSEPSNWNPATVPGPGDDVFIDMVGVYEVTLDVSAEIASLSIGSGTLNQKLSTKGQILIIRGLAQIFPAGELTIGAGSVVSCTGGVENDGIIELADATLNSDVDNHGRFDILKECSCNGSFINRVTGRLRIIGNVWNSRNSTVNFDRGLTNQGQIFMSGDRAGSVTTNTRVTLATGTLTNATGATVRIYNEGSHTFNCGLENYGIIQIDRPLTWNTGASENINAGTIEVRNLGGANKGDLTVDLGTAKGVVGSGTFTQSGSISIDGGRAVRFKQGSLLWETAMAPIGVPTSNLVLGPDSSLYLLTNFDNHIHTTVEDSSLFGPGSVHNHGFFEITNSNIDLDFESFGKCELRKKCTLNGLFENRPGAQLWIIGNVWSSRLANITFDRGWVNQGQVFLIGDRSGSVTGDTRVTLATGTLTNATGATVRIYNEGSHTFNSGLENCGTLLVDRPLTWNTGAYENINAGTIEVRNLGGANKGGFTFNLQAAKATIPNVTITNSGFIRTATDRPFLINTGTFIHTAGLIEGTGILEVGKSARFFGIAPIAMNLVNRGEINPGLPIGGLHINANFTQTAQGKLNIEIGGTSAGKDYDQLSVNGSVNLSGLMNVNLVNGFAPSGLNRFEVFPYQNRYGSFSSLNGLTPVNGVVLLTVYEPYSLTLEAERTLDPLGLMNLIQRSTSRQSNIDELIRRSRTWLRD